VATRLARARARLRDRLLGRGVALSAVVTVVLTESLRAAVPQVLTGSTVTAASALVAGQALTVAAPGAVAGLVAGMVREMVVAKVRATASLVLAFSLALSGGYLTWRTADAAPAEPTRAEVVPDAPPVQRPAESHAPLHPPGTLLRRERASLDPVEPDLHLIHDQLPEKVRVVPAGESVRVFRLHALDDQQACVERTTAVWIALGTDDVLLPTVHKDVQVRVRVIGRWSPFDDVGRP
jgi:hypothetical protein